MDRLFGGFFKEGTPTEMGVWTPSVDVFEKDGNLLVKADLPGVKKENVTITAEKDAVTIEAHTEEEREEKKEGYFHKERRTGRFMRTVPLPVGVDYEKAAATFEDGTVTVTLPKMPEPPKGKTVALN
jgi:HSP20 family protein